MCVCVYYTQIISPDQSTGRWDLGHFASAERPPTEELAALSLTAERVRGCAGGGHYFMYVCVRMQMYIYIYTHIYIYKYADECVHVYRMCIDRQIHMYMYMFVCIDIDRG